jgi:hypothetical protein
MKGGCHKNITRIKANRSEWRTSREKRRRTGLVPFLNESRLRLQQAQSLVGKEEKRPVRSTVDVRNLNRSSERSAEIIVYGFNPE